MLAARRSSQCRGSRLELRRLDGPRAEAPPRYKGTLYLTTSLNPHVLVEPALALPLPGSQSLKPVHSTPSAHAFSKAPGIRGKYVSGGTPWVLSRGVYVAVVHVQPRRGAASGTAPRAGRSDYTPRRYRRYHNFAVFAEAEPPFRITYASPRRPLPLRCIPRVPKPYGGSSVCFASGLVIQDGTVYVSYGSGDDEAWVWTIAEAEFWGAFGYHKHDVR